MKNMSNEQIDGIELKRRRKLGQQNDNDKKQMVWMNQKQGKSVHFREVCAFAPQGNAIETMHGPEQRRPDKYIGRRIGSF